MFFTSSAEIPALAEKSGFSIFVTTNFPDFPQKNSLTIAPDDTGKITVDKVRELIGLCKTKQTSAFFVIIKSAETLNDHAENALLKLLEEPLENYHFILQVKDTSALLPTVLSRGELYLERIKSPLDTPVSAETDVKFFAKRLIAAKPDDLVPIMTGLTSHKDYKKNSRGFALSVADAAIEILYKSFFKTKNPAFLKKLPRFLDLRENLAKNGHIKLHLVADLC